VQVSQNKKETAEQFCSNRWRGPPVEGERGGIQQGSTACMEQTIAGCGRSMGGKGQRKMLDAMDVPTESGLKTLERGKGVLDKRDGIGRLKKSVSRDWLHNPVVDSHRAPRREEGCIMERGKPKTRCASSPSDVLIGRRRTVKKIPRTTEESRTTTSP